MKLHSLIFYFENLHFFFVAGGRFGVTSVVLKSYFWLHPTVFRGLCGLRNKGLAFILHVELSVPGNAYFEKLWPIMFKCILPTYK